LGFLYQKLLPLGHIPFKKLSAGQKSTGEIPSRRGENIAIVTVIELGFIGIIIIITNTIITIITSPSRCNILG
jgi:hypothetical protein